MKLSTALISVIDYLEGEKKSPIRHEYLGGQIFAMSGGSEEHNRIAGNIYTRLLSHLRGSGCKTFMSDMKVNMPMARDTAELFYYPDVMVTCDPQDTERYYKTRPCLIVEVLSPSTQSLDRREKRLNYQSLPSLREYILVSQTQMKVEVYRRNTDGTWSLEILESDDSLELNSVDLTLTMAEIYDEVLTK
ncbi:MAG: Uma2 family endonuclease [Roseofilum sp. SBFL]|uniref:Uma2 family endonuclease n=1 Tax=unclassified Roseofilum TaxID=2620099 RepID=UPI001B078157|nr:MULTISPECIES: Uma2 family endonuclease [unclassified Roseofilum]MBP0015766.1 Uma2 family endonuclease [Roseofilum sp. SID3]MBP0025593.1 Uma2 family endonuclease [Roseofilum sp. SID2]MBP0037692.1 Uma2 family endonuclease [Roseofilum sp. SID1]MBP0041000.1 Uma2 family endonuclease [Roseofilum sp. SBFL]